MPPHFSDLTSSEIVEIVAESGKKRFRVHRSTLDKQPRPLRSTTTAAWQDAAEKKIDLSNWDIDTVGRFVDFLYFGQYQPIPGSARGGGEEVEESRERRNGIFTPDTVQSLADHEEWRQRDEDLDLDANVDPDVLLAHVKVYALAQQEDVDGLKVMALGRLKVALGGVKPEDLGGMPVVEKVIERLCTMRGDLEGWKGRATASDERVQGLEATIATLQQSEIDNASRIREVNAANEARIQQSQTTYNEKVRELAVANKTLEQSQAANAVLQRSEAANVEKIRELETANVEKMRELETAISKQKEVFDNVKKLYPWIEPGGGGLVEHKIECFFEVLFYLFIGIVVLSIIGYAISTPEDPYDG